MKRTSIVAEEQTLYRLRQLAAAKGVSLGEVIREALNEKVSREQPPLTFIGRAGPADDAAIPARAADETDAYQADDFRGDA